jgi:hypothetical protein
MLGLVLRDVYKRVSAARARKPDRSLADILESVAGVRDELVAFIQGQQKARRAKAVQIVSLQEEVYFLNQTAQQAAEVLEQIHKLLPKK